MRNPDLTKSLRTRAGGLLACVLLAAATLSACGGGDDDAPSATSDNPTVNPSATTTSTPTTADIPKKKLPGDVSSKTTSSSAPVPKNGPKKIANFPVPRGYDIKGPAPQSQSWQFDVITKKPSSVLSFYREALAEEGYQVRNDVNDVVGVEQVHYDIQFTGPAEGYIVADPDAGSVFVLVESLPNAS